MRRVGAWYMLVVKTNAEAIPQAGKDVLDKLLSGWPESICSHEASDCVRGLGCAGNM